ncbi:hypothetical protein [Shimia aestuarii]|uniref:Uncharacterized protein n=1 Tax=Shimia aestuarii TaxID=254406 RepID=A0A1I4HSG4_9RHOB|nr:hypothetical protein [Shimia aestuarii]SFL44964.1 hypothetical protein SAMN04488042_101242 [Shimia aestuarii]
MTKQVGLYDMLFATSEGQEPTTFLAQMQAYNERLETVVAFLRALLSGQDELRKQSLAIIDKLTAIETRLNEWGHQDYDDIRKLQRQINALQQQLENATQLQSKRKLN